MADIKSTATEISLDDYIQFLDDFQEIYGPFPVSNVATIDHTYRL